LTGLGEDALDVLGGEKDVLADVDLLGGRFCQLDGCGARLATRGRADDPGRGLARALRIDLESQTLPVGVLEREGADVGRDGTAFVALKLGQLAKIRGVAFAGRTANLV